MHLWDNVQCGTCSIHQVDVECRVIEIERSLITDNGVTGYIEGADSPVDVINHTSVGNNDALGGAS